MELELDRALGVAYLRRSGEQIKHTIELSDVINIDLDRNGTLVGVELLDLTRDLPDSELTSRFGLDEEELQLLKSIIRAA